MDAEIFTLIFIVFGAWNSIVDSKCTIDINKDYNISSPLLLHKNTLDIIYPDKNSPNLLTIKSNQEILLHCTGGQLTKNNVSTDSTSEVSKCLDNLKFTNQHKDYLFTQIGCSKNPNPITKEDKKCGKNGTIVNIGYQVTKTVFKKTIDLCYVDDLATTLWSHSKITGAIGGNKNRDSYTLAFSKGSHFKNVLMSRVYPKSNQQDTFMGIFNGDKSLVDKYLPQNGKEKNNYFVRGHLVARADMFYYTEQYSTYFYLNVLPMWQSINNGNWKSVESTVRRTATFDGDLDVWTGGLGILTLNNKEIYLSKDKKNSSKMLIPAPKLLFKVVSNMEKNEAIVFLTINNPFVDEKDLKEYRVCKEYDTCAQKYAQFRQYFDGYTYCCLLDDFLEGKGVRELKIPIDLKNARALTFH